MSESSPSLPSHVMNRSTRQWVFGAFVIPAGVPTARIVAVPERLHPRGPNEATHAADDAKDAKFKKILLANLADENTGLSVPPSGGAVPEKAREELAELREQNAKLKRLVEAGDNSELVKELEEANRELTAAGDAVIKELEEKLATSQANAKQLFDDATAANNRIADLEARLNSALQAPQTEAAPAAEAKPTGKRR